MRLAKVLVENQARIPSIKMVPEEISFLISNLATIQELDMIEGATLGHAEAKSIIEMPKEEAISDAAEIRAEGTETFNSTQESFLRSAKI